MLVEAPCRALPRLLPGLAAAALGLLAARPAAAATFTKGPYLQALGTTGVTVKLELSEAQAARVEVFPAGSAAQVAARADDDVRFFHSIRVDGLTPATAYEYRVTSKDTEPVTGRFTTAPPDGRPFRFVLYGDSRTDAEAHAAVVRGIEASPSDFLVNTGDMVMTGKDDRDWKTLFAIERGLLRDRCVFAAVGNHELARGDPAGEVAYLRYFGPAFEGGDAKRLYGSFRWSNTRFFVLNAMDNWTGDEREWLRAELDKALAEPGLMHRIAVLHHGPFSSGPHGANERLANGEVNAIMRDRKVDLVLAGHDHDYERGDGDGLKYIVSGGAGAPLYTRKSIAKQTLTFESVHHFVEIAVDGDRIQTVARRASGSVIESCSFRGAAAWECDAGKAAPAATAPGSASAPAGPARAGCGCVVAGDDGEGVGSAIAGAATMALCAIGAVRRRRRLIAHGSER